jgi:hypothetical protein
MAAEAAADAIQAELAQRELRRHRGVAWSGLAPPPYTLRSPETHRAAAEARQTIRQAWQASDGALVGAVAACQTAARDAFTAAERARAGVARGEAAEWRRLAVEELASQARALAKAVRDARRAVE